MMNFRTIRSVPCLALVAVSLLFSACQVATPATRIEQNPVMFESLPEKDKQLVQQGKIRAGMSPEAVFLAWGHPNTQPFEGEKNGKRLLRWVYTRSEPVMVSPAWGAPCPGPYGWCHGYSGMPDTIYIPRNTASVTFEDGKVVSWEAQR